MWVQANLEQAENAGAKPAAEVLKMLGKAAQAALDEKVPLPTYLPAHAKRLRRWRWKK